TKDPYDLVTINYEDGTVTGPTNNPTNTFSQINVGEYYVLYAFGARNFSPKVGFAKLTIEKILLDIIVENYQQVYDAQVHQAPYDILNLDEIPKSPTPEYYYIPMDAVEESKYSVVDIKDFFRAGKPKESPIFALYNKSITSLRDQGTFLAVVYYEDSLNWGRSVGTETVVIKRRPLYFNYLPAQDFRLEVDYDGTKPIVWMGNFEYDTADNSQNKTNPNAGLIRGHQILCSSMAENAFCTSEPDCRGEADNKPWDEPYQKDGDFEFYKMNIQNGQGVNFADNYYPVFNTNPDGSYHVMIIIKRIKLPEFEVWDYIPRLYDKKDAIPHTSIDENYRGVGDFIYYFYKVYKVGDTYQYFEFVNGSNTTALATLHEKDVTTKFQVNGNIVDGYYQVYISVADGRNYYGWTGDFDPDINGGITNQNVFGTDSETGMNGNSQYSFKSAYVQVIPRPVDLEWESLDEIFKLDESGNIVYYTPRAYFIEPDGNKIYVNNIDIYDPETGHILTDETGVKARSIARSGSYPLIAHYSSDNYVIKDNSATFNIAKRVYKISETLSEPWLHTYWNKAYTESYFVEHPEENELEWLPGFSARVVVSTIANKAGVYYRGNHFQKQAQVLDSRGDDYTDCFEFVLDLYLNLTSNELIVQDEYTETYYDENYHWPKIDILSHMNGYVMSYDVIMVRPDGSYYPSEDVDQGTHVINYQANMPTTLENPETTIRHTVFKDIGRYRVFYRVVLGNEKEDDESTVDIKYGTVDVNILQNQSELSFANTGLDRVYNGKAPTILDLQNTIVGRYNGSRGNLIISYREKGSSVDLSDAPIDVGEYEIVVRSSADGNPNYIQNYTPLDAHYEFTIRPREITLNVNTDWQVSEDILNNSTYRWASDGINPSNGVLPANGYIYGDGISQIQNNLSSSSSKYWITQGTDIGLVTSDFLIFKVKSTSYLPRGKYYYKDAQLHETGFPYSYKTGDFELEWNIYYNGDLTRDKSANYRLILDFALDVHYPYMTVNPQDTEYDYTGSPYDLLGNNPANNGKKNIEIVQPATGWTILYGDN
ncbi:MAG: hypothetical protein K2K15_01780, partial [Anaeroplasmataceae bacterium]|nr:hypothetical protein [Anaeroplasmataceae bacterium]